MLKSSKVELRSEPLLIALNSKGAGPSKKKSGPRTLVIEMEDRIDGGRAGRQNGDARFIETV